MSDEPKIKLDLPLPQVDKISDVIHQATVKAIFAQNLRRERELHLYCERLGVAPEKGVIEKAASLTAEGVAVIRMVADEFVGIPPLEHELHLEHTVKVEYQDGYPGEYTERSYRDAVNVAHVRRTDIKALVVTIWRGDKLVGLMLGDGWE
jgi:hypothetical protein